jgi:uncharacterized sporulation protein YeaH/YhbH (DUF444 family)
MVMKIERDTRRFRQIVRGRIRKNLRKYVTHGEMIGRKGRDLVSIPVPQLDIPHFRFGDNGAGGVGQGDGEEGQPIGKGGNPKSGPGQAGSDPGGGHLLEVDISLEELAAILGEELALPREVDEHTFYHTRESGGTRISSAYKACARLIEEQFPPSEWNLYCFQFSDGDNWGEDNEEAFRVLGERLLPIANLFCYGQVESPYGSGEFLGYLHGRFGEHHESLVLSEIEDRDGIYESIKTFLGKGK